MECERKLHQCNNLLSIIALLYNVIVANNHVLNVFTKLEPESIRVVYTVFLFTYSIQIHDNSHINVNLYSSYRSFKSIYFHTNLSTEIYYLCRCDDTFESFCAVTQELLRGRGLVWVRERGRKGGRSFSTHFKNHPSPTSNEKYEKMKLLAGVCFIIKLSPYFLYL